MKMFFLNINFFAKKGQCNVSEIMSTSNCDRYRQTLLLFSEYSLTKRKSFNNSINNIVTYKIDFCYEINQKS